MTRKEAPSCPRPLSMAMHADPTIFQRTRTLYTHKDFDGVVSGATFLLQGTEPYSGAFKDADIFDAVLPDAPTPTGLIIQHALKGEYEPEKGEKIRYDIISWLVDGDVYAKRRVTGYAKRYIPVLHYTEKMAREADIIDGVAFVGILKKRVDQTKLSRLLQARGANHYILQFRSTYDGQVKTTVATSTDLDLLRVFNLPAGAPFRVTLGDDYALDAITTLLRGSLVEEEPLPLEPVTHEHVA